MKLLYRFYFFTGTLLTLLSFLIFPSAAFADTYGSGSYGSNSYGGGTSGGSASGGSNIVSTISSSVSSTVSSVTQSVTAFFCTNQQPSSAPNLYEIDVKGSTAKLYYAPAAGPADRHYISFGQGNNNEGYGGEYGTDNPKGALTFEATKLAPNSFYTFKVRGGNGCKPGSWSSNLTIKTQKKGSKALVKYYTHKQAKYVEAKAPKKQSWWGSVVNKVFPQK